MCFSPHRGAGRSRAVLRRLTRPGGGISSFVYIWFAGGVTAPTDWTGGRRPREETAGLPIASCPAAEPEPPASLCPGRPGWLHPAPGLSAQFGSVRRAFRRGLDPHPVGGDRQALGGRRLFTEPPRPT